MSTRIRFGVTFAASFLIFASPLCAEPLVERYRPSVVFINPVATTSSGAVLSLRSGTGFIVSSMGHVLTTFHIIRPPEKDVAYDKVEVMGAVGTRYEKQYKLEVIKSDIEGDLLLLQLPWLGQSWKSLKLCHDLQIDVDTPLVSLGYPLVSDLVTEDGKLKARFGPQGLWQSNLPLNPGDSGGPVLTSDGVLVGIAKAGLEYNETVNKSYMATGISYLIPIQYADSLLRNALARDECPSATATTPPAGSPLIFAMDDTKDDHPTLVPDTREYERIFRAPAGIKMTSVKFEGSQNNLSDLRLDISLDGSVLKVHYQLTSGPVFDRWRGWISGNIVARTVGSP